MRQEKEMMALIQQFIEEDERVRVAMLEGSRTNLHVTKDMYQDYDVSFFVTDLASYEKDDAWLSFFGQVLFLQKPERMTLYPADYPTWMSYITYFDDGIKMDISLIPLHEINDYLKKSDGLMQLLSDKDGRVINNMVPTDQQYWIQRPTPEMLADCCNEFWSVVSYVVKGIYREDYFFAADHLNEIVRKELLRVIGWRIGYEYGFNFSLGKKYKYLKRYMTEEDYAELLKTFEMHNLDAMMTSCKRCCELFEHYTNIVAQHLNIPSPTEGVRMRTFLKQYDPQK